MDDLILADLLGRITPAEAARLLAWRQVSSANEAQYQETRRLWHASSHRDPLAAHALPPPLNAIRAQATLLRRSSVPRGILHRRRWTVPLAAALGVTAVGLVAALAVLVVRPSWLGHPSAEGLRAAEFVTDATESATARLHDGTVVRLAPSSSLRVLPVPDRREVWLDGEAFFVVARDPERSYRVRTRAGVVEVLGTRFDVQVIGSDLRLIVTEGKVALLAGGERVTVVAGEMATVGRDGVPFVTSVPNPEALLTWMHDVLIFQDTPLREVAHELEARYGVRVVLLDSALASRTVTAWFARQKLEQVLTAVCHAVEVQCTLRDGVASMEP